MSAKGDIMTIFCKCPLCQAESEIRLGFGLILAAVGDHEKGLLLILFCQDLDQVFVFFS